MTTIPSNPGAPPEPRATGGRLSKEERRELLARIERESSRAEPPESILERAEQALQSGNRTQAERLVLQLERTDPNLLGLAHLKSRLAEASLTEKQRANIRKAEDMLLRYIEQRKKTAAEFALEALGEIAPAHPKLEEYKIWVRDLDKEAAAQLELDSELAAGRMALQVGDLEVARRHLERLQGLDGQAIATVQLTSEISQAEAGQAETADIEGIKQRFEEHLLAMRIREAEGELAHLAEHVIPKITLDRLKVRLEETKSADRNLKELEAFEQLYQEYLRRSLWQKARDVARQAGQRFPQHPRPAEMFAGVNLREADARQQESTRQGVVTLEKFIAEGKRDEAELALKLLKGKVEEAQLAELEERLRSL